MDWSYQQYQQFEQLPPDPPLTTTRSLNHLEQRRQDPILKS